MQLADALSRCPARASQEIKLDMRVDYIAFTKPWIEKLKESMQRDPILATVYQLTQQGWPHQRRHVPCLARRYWVVPPLITCVVCPSEGGDPEGNASMGCTSVPK